MRLGARRCQRAEWRKQYRPAVERAALHEQAPRLADPGGAYHVKRSPLLYVLRAFALLIPGDWLKTFFYLHCIAAPRRALRRALF
ncbi:MAG TPA: hypothetical protein VMG33_05895, partial [Steroidobacteraceae bacterium]|nr:hypothetical protein [Steroidobacteraceae bacterium]